jgi:hypothetical protein
MPFAEPPALTQAERPGDTTLAKRRAAKLNKVK